MQSQWERCQVSTTTINEQGVTCNYSLFVVMRKLKVGHKRAQSPEDPVRSMDVFRPNYDGTLILITNQSLK